MGEMTREEELAAMTHQQLLAYQRERHGNPYMPLSMAKKMQKLDFKFMHLGAAQKKAERESQEEARCRLHEKLFSSDSRVLESDG